MKKIAKWESPSNIALIKYWGKHGGQLPNNPSISFTLTNSKTITSVELVSKTDKNIEFLFNNDISESFSTRIENFLNSISSELPFINDYSFIIKSKNTFPHSAGIASSASAFSALALCLIDLKQQLGFNITDFFSEASYFARLGSGSACRSVYGGVALWGKTDLIENSSNKFAVSLNDIIHPIFKNYHDDIIIVNSEKKHISSSLGHKLMDTNPYRNIKYKQSKINLTELLLSLKSGNLTDFIRITESEALSLHSMMMLSNPSFILLQPKTLQIISEIIRFRNHTKIPISFTLDAGPNVHVLYPHKFTDEVKEFLSDNFNHNCQIINDFTS